MPQASNTPMGAQELLLTQLAMSLGYVRAVKDFLVPE